MNLQSDLSSWLKELEDFNNSFSKNEKFIPRIVITEASTSIARSLIYRILNDEVFGPNQEIIISLYDSLENSRFLNSLVIEVTACAPNILNEIQFSHDVSKSFKDANVVFSIGRARGYNFSEEEIFFNDPFFKETVTTAKIHAMAIDLFAKKDVKVITVGNTEASIINVFTKSIPSKNITSLALILSRITAAQVCVKLHRNLDEIRNIIPWGATGRRFYPDLKFSTFKNGKPVIAETKKAWIKKDFSLMMRRALARSRYSRGVAYALADHCKILFRGTAKEWTCMGILSDGSYGVPAGIFFTFPVHCKGGNYEIVKGLSIDEYCKRRHIQKLSEEIQTEVKAALHICHYLTVQIT